MLRAGSWFPRRGRLEVIVEAPVLPDGGDWAAAIRLRDAARAAILRHCGEPDLGDSGAGRRYSHCNWSGLVARRFDSGF